MQWTLFKCNGIIWLSQCTTCYHVIVTPGHNLMKELKFHVIVYFFLIAIYMVDYSPSIYFMDVELEASGHSVMTSPPL